MSRLELESPMAMYFRWRDIGHAFPEEFLAGVQAEALGYAAAELRELAAGIESYVAIQEERNGLTNISGPGTVENLQRLASRLESERGRVVRHAGPAEASA